MKISTKGRYGLLALVDIAARAEGGCVTLKSVAQRQGLSEPYLERIIAALKKAGFVASVRGAAGGYRLNCIPGETSVGDILHALEGPLYPTECLGEVVAGCGHMDCSSCVARPVWEQMYESANDILASVSLERLVRDYQAVEVRRDNLEP